MKSFVSLIAAILLSLSAFAQHDMGHGSMPSTEQVSVSKAIAVMVPTQGNKVAGTVIFTAVSGGLEVVAHITGLTAGKHGFHIHQFGDCSAPDAASAGGHYMPTGHMHGAPTDSMRHDGDLGNLVADSTGTAHYEYFDKTLTLTGPKSIIGLAVIAHASEDDLKTQPTGNSGARVACGVIGIAKP